MKNIWKKIKKIFLWISHNPAITTILAGSAIVIIAIIMFSLSTLMIDRRPLINIEGQEQAIVSEKDKQITELNKIIEELQKQNIKSVEKYMELRRKISELEKEKQSIKKPEGVGEIKTRFNNLGYPVK